MRNAHSSNATAGAHVRAAGLLSLALLASVLAAGTAFGATLGLHAYPVSSTNPCRYCHDTASGTPALRGWNGTPPAGVGTWGAKPLSNLCYQCHTTGHASSAHGMAANAYANSSHGCVATKLPREPDGSPQGTQFASPGASGLPYTGAGLPQIECSTCHNVHNASNRPFNQQTSLQLLCLQCHAGHDNNSAIRSIAGSARFFSTHPTRRSLGDTARANIKTEAEIDPNLRVGMPAAPNYALGGHLSSGATGVLDCQTCHAIHGPTQGAAGLTSLLAIDNVTTAGTADPSLLCEGCHYGGAAGEQVGTIVPQSGLPAGQWSDHPIDGNSNRSFYPTGAALPTLWTAASTPNFDLGAQPFSGTTTNTVPVCSSCHDTHGGMAGTALLRGPQPTGVWGAFSYNDWCFACHTLTQVIPPAHHSVAGNLGTALGDAIDSQLTCGDCHGPVGTTSWTAHNGFWAWPAGAAVSPTDSVFCEKCHARLDPADLVAPALKGQTFIEPAAFPATHGTVRGTASHYLGPDSGEFPGVAPKLTAWASGYFSSYGSPNTGGGGQVAPGTGEIICTSCHNMLFNDGRANPTNYVPVSTPPTLKAGWRSNLLLERYEDDPPGNAKGAGAGAVGSALCTGCHDPSVGNHHPITSYPPLVGYPPLVPLTGLALRTGGLTLADQTTAPIGGGAAPGTLSYPNDNQMDCDSCHRPHRADSDSDVAPGAHGSGNSTPFDNTRPTRHILEVDGPSHRYSPDLCAECHNR